MARDRFVPVCLSSFLVTAALLTPNAVRAAPAAPAAASAPAPMQVVRLGDNAMTCEALSAEIGTLANPGATPVAAKPKKKRGFGFLSALGGAVPFVGGMGGMLVSTAASTAAQAAADSHQASAMEDAERMARDAAAGGSPEQQRRTRLAGLFDRKGC